LCWTLEICLNIVIFVCDLASGSAPFDIDRPDYIENMSKAALVLDLISMEGIQLLILIFLIQMTLRSKNKAEKDTKNQPEDAVVQDTTDVRNILLEEDLHDFQ
jgi:hypothetical protein